MAPERSAADTACVFPMPKWKNEYEAGEGGEGITVFKSDYETGAHVKT